jgi:small conductance mechanosensitive channel
MNTFMDKVSNYVAYYGMKILAAIAIFVIGKWIARFVSQLAEKLMLKAKVDPTLATFTKHIINVGFMIFVVIAALSQLGIQTASFIAVLGAAGLAIGLALQGSLSNFSAGVMLILFHTFRVGDFIEAAGVIGTVQEIQIFNTVLISADGKQRIIVPNSKITADKIVVHEKK